MQQFNRIERVRGMAMRTVGMALAGTLTGALALSGQALAQAGTTGQTDGLTVASALPPVRQAPSQVAADAPNILVVMIDDAGYGQFGTFGGAVPSPAFDALAKEGVRFTRFHTAGICSPTRAALLTGRNPHNVGFGNVGELSNGYDGYTGILPDNAAPIPRLLSDKGYVTAMFGKNHNTPQWETGPAGPYNHWPTGMGFRYFYGFHGWGADQYNPTLFENTNIVPPHHDPDYTLNEDLADHAISWMRTAQSAAPNNPIFAYFATGGVHAPLQVPEEWIKPFEGQFDAGWDAYREAAFKRQKQLGVIPADTELTPRPDSVPAWDSLSAEEKRIAARGMEVFAGFSAQTEYEIGRVIEAAQAIDNGRETMVVLIMGDNGASAEGGRMGTVSELSSGQGLREEAVPTLEQLPELGGPKYENHMPYGWAWAANTPFQYFKQVVSHLGATRNPMIVSWPGKITDPGTTRDQFLFVSDLAPTILAAAGVEAPTSVDGVEQSKMDGTDATGVITHVDAPEVRTVQYFEVFGNRGIYSDGWFASAKLADPWVPRRDQLDPLGAPWELYNLDADFSQAHDLAAENPAQLDRMKTIWWTQAAQNHVLPINWDAGAAIIARRQDFSPRSFTFYPGTIGLPESLAPNVRNRSWQITASGAFKPSDTGMIATQGGMPGGWAFYLEGGVPRFDYNLSSVDHYRIAATAPIGEGVKQLEMRFAYAGKPGERGKGGTVELLADGRVVASGALPRTLPSFFSINETFDIGADYGSPVALDYTFPAPFTGDLEKVVVDLK